MAPTSNLQPLLKRAAPHLARHFFACRQCLNKPLNAPQTRLATSYSRPTHAIRQTPFLKAFRAQSGVAAMPKQLPPLNSFVRQSGLSEGTGWFAKSPAEKGGYFPKTSRNIVAWWLLGSSISVFGLVVLGGLTRLTESGLSITEWKPVTGTMPPMSPADWHDEFKKYKASPEFQKLNPNMTESEFKKIFWMEWSHRLWGRVVGLTFVIPTIYLIARKRVSLPIARNLLLLNGLIATQGFVGWWMVKSGLKDDLFATGAHPRVSQYRLATHLTLAFAVYTGMVWNALQIWRERRLLIRVQPERALALLERLRSPPLAIFRRSALALTFLIGITAFSGALVAGLDAGLIYNEFPYMGNGLTPPKAELWSAFYSRKEDQSDLWWRNMLENPSLVQLDHRILASTTFLAVNTFFLYSKLSPSVVNVLPGGSKRMMLGLLGLVWMQASLGLTTLLYLVPTTLASAHQAGSLALLTGAIVLGSRVWTPPRLARMVKARAIKVRGTIERRQFREAQLKENLHKAAQTT